MNINNEPEVLLEREGKTWRWGQSEYFTTWSGLKQTVSQSAVKKIALPIALLFGLITFFFSKSREILDYRGTEVNTPNVSSNLPIIAAPILSNIPGSSASARNSQQRIDRIEVFNLRSLIDIPVGTEAKAVLVSGASNGIVKAKLVNAMKVDNEPILPEGTIIFGNGISTEERLYIEFRRAIFPSGENFAIRGQGFDLDDKILGLKGAFVGNKGKKMGLAIGFGLLGGLADGMQTSGSTNMWGVQQKRSVSDAALGGASKAALDQSQAYMDEMKNAPTIIEVKKGTEFYLIIDEPKPKEAYGK